MMRRLIVDHTGDEDEASMLVIIAASQKAGDMAALLDGSDVYEVRQQLNGPERDRFDAILRQTSYFAVISVGNAAYFIRRCAQEATDGPQRKWILEILLTRAGQWPIFELIGEGKIAPGVARVKEELEDNQWQAVWASWQMAKRPDVSRSAP